MKLVLPVHPRSSSWLLVSSAGVLCFGFVVAQTNRVYDDRFLVDATGPEAHVR